VVRVAENDARTDAKTEIDDPVAPDAATATGTSTAVVVDTAQEPEIDVGAAQTDDRVQSRTVFPSKTCPEPTRRSPDEVAR